MGLATHSRACKLKANFIKRKSKSFDVSANEFANIPKDSPPPPNLLNTPLRAFRVQTPATENYEQIYIKSLEKRIDFLESMVTKQMTTINRLTETISDISQSPCLHPTQSAGTAAPMLPVAKQPASSTAIAHQPAATVTKTAAAAVQKSSTAATVSIVR